jgi:hypothetical protein
MVQLVVPSARTTLQAVPSRQEQVVVPEHGVRLQLSAFTQTGTMMVVPPSLPLSGWVAQ